MNRGDAPGLGARVIIKPAQKIKWPGQVFRVNKLRMGTWGFVHKTG